MTDLHLKILLPYKIFTDLIGIKIIIAETKEGSFGILPNRLDCVSAMSAGILTYMDAEGREVYVAIDEGILVKTGSLVLISVRNAISGTDLSNLHEAVEREFLDLDQGEKDTRSVLNKMETGFINRIARYYHE